MLGIELRMHFTTKPHTQTLTVFYTAEALESAAYAKQNEQ